jgi:hypothetical protein
MKGNGIHTLPGGFSAHPVNYIQVVCLVTAFVFELGGSDLQIFHGSKRFNKGELSMYQISARRAMIEQAHECHKKLTAGGVETGRIRQKKIVP